MLHRLAGCALGDGRLLDASGLVRVRWPAPTWEDFLALAVDEIIVYGAGSLQVSRRLQALLEDLAARVPRVHEPAVRARIAILAHAVQRAYSDARLTAEAVIADRQGIGSPRRPAGPAA